MNCQSATYVFGGNQNELERLLGQAGDLKPESTWLLDQVGIEKGWRVADIGCGPIGVLDLLSERVGPTGTVTGLEREPPLRRHGARGDRQARAAECRDCRRRYPKRGIVPPAD